MPLLPELPCLPLEEASCEEGEIADAPKRRRRQRKRPKDDPSPIPHQNILKPPTMASEQNIPDKPSTNTTAEDVRRMIVCKFFKSQSCNSGNCPFSHDLKLEACVFWHLKGGCLKGQECPYSHSEITPLQKRALEIDQEKFLLKEERFKKRRLEKENEMDTEAIPDWLSAQPDDFAQFVAPPEPEPPQDHLTEGDLPLLDTSLTSTIALQFSL